MKTQAKYDAALTAEEFGDGWTLTDDCGARFWPQEEASTAAEAFAAERRGAGLWYS